MSHTDSSRQCGQCDIDRVDGHAGSNGRHDCHGGNTGYCTGTLGNTEYAADKISQEQYLYYGTAIDAQCCDQGISDVSG